LNIAYPLVSNTTLLNRFFYVIFDRKVSFRAYPESSFMASPRLTDSRLRGNDTKGYKNYKESLLSYYQKST
jgi:hypothetical protein